MKSLYSTFLLAVSLFVYSGWPGSAWSAARPSKEAPPASSATVTIPGPLRSFLRMAGISQKASPEDVLPLLANNVFQMGYQQGKPTEFLILLQRYVRQARELQALAGADGVIRVSNCNEAAPLLTILGYRLREACGPSTALETALPKIAFLTIDSGFPLADLEQSLQEGKPFARSYRSTPVPLLFSQHDWMKGDKNKQDDLLDVLLRDPALARLYWAMAHLDENTRTIMWRSLGPGKLTPLAPVLDFYGSHIYIRSGVVLVPGGTSAESAWQDLVGARPNSPRDFISSLLASDMGWLAAYFDALSRVSSTQQSYFTNPRRLRRYYEALRGRKASPGAARGVYRPNPGLFLLVTRLQWEPTGEPHVPGNLEVWKAIVSGKANSKLFPEVARGANQWNSSDELVEALFGLSRIYAEHGLLEVYLTLSALDRGRSPQQRLNPETVRLLAEKFPRFNQQYLVFSEFRALNDDSITRFLSVAEAIDRIPDPRVRTDAVGIFQANVGLWQILARQEQIPTENWNPSWQRVISPFVGIVSSAQLFDAARTSLGEVLRAAGARPQLPQDELVDLLAGPKQTSPEGQRVKQKLADNIRAVLDAQRLVSLDNLFALGDGLNQMAQGKLQAETLLPLATELREFELPKPLFTRGERMEWANGLYTTPHIQAELQMDFTTILKSTGSPDKLAEGRGQLTPFLRDSLVGLNYAYYEPPGAQMLLNNPLFVRAHDFSQDKEQTPGADQPWQTPQMRGRGYAASGGAHLTGSLAELPYVLAQVEQNFIVPENTQALIWEDLVPSLLASAVLPRWWRVTRSELEAVTLYQRFGEELLAAAEKNEELQQEVTGILSDRLLPQDSEKVKEALRGGRPGAALSLLSPGETFYLAAEFRRRFPEDTHYRGKTGQELDNLRQRYPKEVSWERLSEDFGVPHPALEQTYARELLEVKPFPTCANYASRLLAESWDSNNLYWARLADEGGYSPAMLHLLVPELTHRMVRKIFATHSGDWPALLRALRETGEDFRQGKVATLPSRGAVSSPEDDQRAERISRTPGQL